VEGADRQVVDRALVSGDQLADGVAPAREGSRDQRLVVDDRRR
jgi:hypothetical protein